MVGRGIENHCVGVLHHHAGDHAAHFFTTRQYRRAFEQFFTGEEHFAEESFQIDFARIVGVLREPVYQIHVGVEERGVVQRQVGGCDRLPPVVRSFVRFHFAVDDFEQGGHGTRVARDEYDFVVFFDREVHVAEKHLSVDGFFQTSYFQNLISRLALRREDNTRIAARRGLYLFDVQFFQHLFPAGRLFRFRYVGTEPLDKFLQFFFLFFRFLVLLLLLAECQLARFVPETVIAGKQLYAVEVDIDRVGTNRVEEVAVVRYDQHRVLEVGKIIFEPHNGFKVEVVGRLVEQEVVGMSEEGFRQQYAHFLFTAQVFHQHVVLLFLDA